VLGALGAAATVAAATIAAPQTFSITGPAGIVAFVVAAGCLAADTIPYRPLHATLAAASAADAVLLALGGQIGVPVILPAVLLLAFQPAPAAHGAVVARTRARRMR
jgi:hypothetical protein